MKKISITLVLLWLGFLSFAQDGKINGTVIDAETGEEIIGARIIINGSDPLIGTVSDYTGSFSLSNISSQNAILECSFLSYETQKSQAIAVDAGGIHRVIFKLKQASEEIQEVLVTAKAITDTEGAMQNLQRKSGSLINGLSAQLISKMGDSDAASALKRVSGVSVSDGKYVYVRGLSDRYSKVTLNKAEIPGLDPNKNTVQMDIFPSNIIDNIVVHKTFTPNLPASFSGGYVDIVTKSFPDKFMLQFSASSGYNSKANLRSDFLLYEGGQYDFFGIDDGTRAVPEAAQNGIPALYTNNDKLDEITASFNKTMETKNIQSPLNQSYSFSVGNNVKLFKRSLGFIFSGTYSNTFNYYNDGELAEYSLVNADGGRGIMTPSTVKTERAANQEVMLSGLVGLSYQYSENGKIGLNVMRNNSGLKSGRLQEGNKIEDDIYVYGNMLGFQERSLSTAQLNGEQKLGKYTIGWQSSYTISEQSEPDLRFFNYDYNGRQFQISPNAYSAPARFFRDLSELNMDNKLNVSVHTTFLGKTTDFDFGLAYIYKDRASDSKKFNLLSQQLDFNGSIDDYLSDENIGQNADAIYGIYYQNDPLTDLYNSYKASEIVAAAYSMLDMEWSSKLRMVAGVRYEYNQTTIENNVESYHHKYVSKVKTYPTDLMPSVNFNYSLFERTNIRLALTRTLARPSFREIAPYAYYDFKEGWRVVGNPELERTLVNNIDARWEHFLKRGELVSFSLFYKNFINPIELVDDPRANNPEFHYINIDNSNLYGFEIELRKRLDFVGLNNFSLGGNYSLLKSEVKYVDNFGSEQAGISIRRPMYGQSPWVINSFLSYNNRELQLSSNLGFNMAGEKLAVVTKGDTPNIYTHPEAKLNVNISKGFGEHLSMKLSVSNILDSKISKTYNYLGRDYNYQSYSLGRTFSVGLSYKI
ncbi:MAG: TonB-dependent receptor [Bacteroidota bacterium]|nr:TonB-dependent receptor [Bacteroidota bacterium]